MTRPRINIIVRKFYFDGAQYYSHHGATVFSLADWRRFAAQASHCGCTITIYQPARHD